MGIFLARLTKALRGGDKAELQGFGSSRTQSRNARQRRNPGTGSAVPVPARKAPFFVAGKELRESITCMENGWTGGAVPCRTFRVR